MRKNLRMLYSVLYVVLKDGFSQEHDVISELAKGDLET